MPIFKVLRRVDAFIDYTTEVDAANPIEAAAVARANADSLAWTGCGAHEHDAKAFFALDGAGFEIPDSECGDF